MVIKKSPQLGPLGQRTKAMECDPESISVCVRGQVAVSSVELLRLTTVELVIRSGIPTTKKVPIHNRDGTT